MKAQAFLNEILNINKWICVSTIFMQMRQTIILYKWSLYSWKKYVRAFKTSNIFFVLIFRDKITLRSLGQW